jgi:hypothetical protein
LTGKTVSKEAPLLHNRHQHVTAERGQLLKPLLWGELEPLGLKGLELVSKLRATPVTHPDVDGHEEGFCVKIVEGVLTILPHGTPSFFTS